jgi:hypothetical protein
MVKKSVCAGAGVLYKPPGSPEVKVNTESLTLTLINRKCYNLARETDDAPVEP